MNISELQSFLAIVEYHSISLAAKKLHISQPALSKRIKKLEAHWNTPLFISTGLRTELTTQGKQLLPYIRQMIYLNDELNKKAGVDKKKPKLLINIGVSVYIETNIIPELIMYLNSLELDYLVITNLISDNNVFQGLKEGHYDLTISAKPPEKGTELKSIFLWQEKIIPVVSYQHPLAKIKGILSIADLIKYDAILVDKSLVIRQLLDEEVEGKSFSLKIKAQTNNIYSTIAVVEEGLGWSMIYERLLNSNLVPIKLSDFSPTITFHCHLLKARADDRLIRVFIDHLLNWVNTSNLLKAFTVNRNKKDGAF